MNFLATNLLKLFQNEDEGRGLIAVKVGLRFSFLHFFGVIIIIELR